MNYSQTLEDKRAYIETLIRTEWRRARTEREPLTEVLLQLAGFSSMQEFLKVVAPQTTVVTIVGGAASRWDKSFDDPQGSEIAQQYGIDRTKSRFLASVPNILPGNTDENSRIPILSYNLYGIRNILLDSKSQPLAKHVLIYSKDNEVDEIKTITDAAGITQTQLCKQEIRPGKVKPFGHADALLQHVDLITSTPYVLTHFGGDVISPKTVELSLLCLYALNSLEVPVDVILPTALMDVPKYPVYIDQTGLPRQFGHEKLLGKDSLHAETVVLSQGGSNIGIRVYKSKALKNALEVLAPRFEQAEEFALDHVDQYFADSGRIRQLCISLPEEISHAAKTLTEIPFFLENERVILELE